ncbi:MAG: hypothetical protein ABIR15_06085 [Chitinophagaceae bacterium]
MKKLNTRVTGMIMGFVVIAFILNSCTKDQLKDPEYNLDVLLSGGKSQGYLKFRQNADAAKIIDLDIKVSHLTPNHDYLLQRAVDSADNNCTSTAWLTLGKGLTPQSIKTDNAGNGEEALWRDVTALPTGAKYDIHFQVIDAVSLEVVLTSSCYQYTIR